MLKFKVGQSNYKNLPLLAEKWREQKVKILEIELIHQSKERLRFFGAAHFLSSLLDYEAYFEIWLKNMPFCILADDARDHILNDKNFKGEKLPKCKKCFYFKKCSGFPQGYFEKFSKSEVKPIKDLPCEVMVEIEPRCNFDCQFCFNKISFAKKGREKIRGFGTDDAKKIIKAVAKSGVKIIRFTGGEPMLRKDIFELLRFAKNLGLETRLNTNASLIDRKKSQKFKGILDNVLIPIESCESKSEQSVCGFPQALERKINAIRFLRKSRIPVVRGGTVATRENIRNLDKIAKFVANLHFDQWELYRPIASKENKFPIQRKDVEILINKLAAATEKYHQHFFIANALPFCAVKDKNKINSLSLGALFDDGHSRLVIDPRGFIKPHYFLDKKLAKPAEISKAWQHPFMRKMRNLEFAPEDCRDCAYLQKCRGGSRFAAKLSFGRWDAKDPLMPSKNVLNNN